MGMYKFRAMVTGANRAGPALTYRDDPRITEVGRLLRDVQLDELQHLINVLTGEMSLVGPRRKNGARVRAARSADLARGTGGAPGDLRPGPAGLRRRRGQHSDQRRDRGGRLHGACLPGQAGDRPALHRDPLAAVRPEDPVADAAGAVLADPPGAGRRLRRRDTVRRARRPAWPGARWPG